MKRLRRIAWNGLAMISALLFVATVATLVQMRHEVLRLGSLEGRYGRIDYLLDGEELILGVGKRRIVVYYPMFLGTVLFPVLFAYSKFRKGQNKKNGHCPACGYDLRATPDRCPECGTVPEKKSEKSFDPG